ncbi:MAG: flagellar basal body-associated FliL family protein [Candidatus Gastranaerophilales bacterium]|nr:flagellar basal body-associated FliL family protein [Candidatus Gastranaerophilales bacterium]MCM1073286.1 flagellar basal body-associated FliL family protein [Bacteroides sp.]
MADNEQMRDGNSINKILITNLASMVIMFLVFTGVFYLIMDNMMTKKIANIQVSQEELDEGDEGDEIERGIIVDLGDFILNLCDEAQKKYLKVNVAIEVTQKDTDFAKEEPAKGGGHGHGEAPAPADPMEAIQKEMAQFKPAIRDAVITNLSSKTSSELASAAGKELAKEQIANDINSILGGEREVLRVSFGQFIIQ